MEPDKIHIDNLREALRQVERYVLIGFFAAFSFVLLQFGTPGQAYSVPGFTIPVDPITAKVLLVAAYIVAGYIAFGNLEVAKVATSSIANDSLLNATLLHPTLTTSVYPVFRFIACF